MGDCFLLLNLRADHIGGVHENLLGKYLMMCAFFYMYAAVKFCNEQCLMC